MAREADEEQSDPSGEVLGGFHASTRRPACGQVVVYVGRPVVIEHHACRCDARHGLIRVGLFGSVAIRTHLKYYSHS